MADDAGGSAVRGAGLGAAPVGGWGEMVVGSNSVPLLSIGGDANRADMMDREIPTLEAAQSRFVEAALDFRQWAEDYPADRKSAEWEADYAKWSELTCAFCDFLDASGPDSLDQTQVDLLLYVLARDNEGEVLKDELVSRPAHLISLAVAAPLSIERDARWQIADALGNVEINEEVVEPLIEHFLRDADEYVSRRALIALTRKRSAKLDVWAVRAWNTGNEYQRIAALEAFATSGSPLLWNHLDQAEADGRQYLARFARELRDRLTGP